MSTSVKFTHATPVLASLDIERSVEFFVSRLGFTKVYATSNQYGIVESGVVEIHFWFCSDRAIAEATSCRVRVEEIEKLFAHCESHGIVHPNAGFEVKPWETKEFAILDPDGNLVTFYEKAIA